VVEHRPRLHFGGQQRICLAQRQRVVAASAPSGANVQPWRFVVVTNRDRKRRLRLAAEAEERDFCARPAPAEWLDALSPIGTDWRKPFLEIVPAVIVVFKVHQGPRSPKAYYVKESVGIAVGLLIAAPRCATLVWPG
jgi:nitroreductase